MITWNPTERSKMTTEKLERAKKQARAQLDSIVVMVKRLEHCQECDGDACELSDEEIYEGINLYYREGDVASEEEKREYHDRDKAEEIIREDPLLIEVRTGWHTPGECEEPMEYCILLCTGGPACQIIGDLDEYLQPSTARLEYQDWFTPWISYNETSEGDNEALLTYARQFYFGI